MLKGYTTDQLAASEDIRVWTEMLGAFFAFVRLTALANVDLKSVEHLDCRKEMQDATALVIDGVAVAPATGASDIGGIQYGRVSIVDTEARKFRNLASRWRPTGL